MLALLNISKNKYKVSFLIVVPFISLLSIKYSGFTHGPVLCIFRFITGHPCPACGSIRSIGALAQGDVISAWQYNPLTLICSVTFVVYIFFPNMVNSICNTFEQHVGIKKRVGRNMLPYISLGFVMLWICNLQRW